MEIYILLGVKKQKNRRHKDDFKPRGGRRRNHLVLHIFYRWIISLTKHMIDSLLSLMFCINLNLIYNVYPARIFSVHCVKIDFIGISILCFRRRPQEVSLRPLHCDVKCFDCDKWKSQTMCISNLRFKEVQKDKLHAIQQLYPIKHLYRVLKMWEING